MRSKALTPLLDLFANANSSISSQICGCNVLKSLADTREHQSLIAHAGLTKLSPVLESADLRLQAAAVALFRTLLSNEENHSLAFRINAQLDSVLDSIRATATEAAVRDAEHITYMLTLHQH